MSTQRYDATVKNLVEPYPADWLAQCGLATSQPVDLIDADLATITTAADKVLRVRDEEPWLVHLELQSSWDGSLPRRILKYNVLLHDRHDLPVHSVAVLLRRDANSPHLSGKYSYRSPRGVGQVEFDYQVLRVWQQPTAVFLAGGLGTLPLAPLTDEAETDLPGLIRRMKARLEAEAAPEQAETLWAATFILMGLRYTPEFSAQLLQGVGGMKDSSTYQWILAQGAAEGEAKGEAKGSIREARKLLLRLGSKRLGVPDAATQAAIDAIGDVERLERMIERAQEAASWTEVLATP